MDLWRLFRRKPPVQPEPERYRPEPGPLTPRKCLYRTFAGRPAPCPRCGGVLRAQSHTYLIATRRGARATGAFLVGNDMGWFCADCPTVVVDLERVSDVVARSGAGRDLGDEFAVLGFVDHKAIPPSKAHVRLDVLDPLPLVPFDASFGQCKTDSGDGAERDAHARGVWRWVRG